MWFGKITPHDVLADIRDGELAREQLLADARCIGGFLDRLSKWLDKNRDVFIELFPGESGFFKKPESEVKYKDLKEKVEGSKKIVKTIILEYLGKIGRFETMELPMEIKEKITVGAMDSKVKKSTKAALGKVKKIKKEFKELFENIDYVNHFLIVENRDKAQSKVVKAKIRFLEHMIDGFKWLMVREDKDWKKFDEDAEKLKRDIDKLSN